MSFLRKTAASLWIIAAPDYFISPMTGDCMDIYAPSLPEIAHYFSSSAIWTQQTMATYMLNYGLSQFPFGPLSDIAQQF